MDTAHFADRLTDHSSPVRAIETMRFAAFLIGVVALALVHGRPAGAQAPPALVVSPDGSEVINAEAGVAWARCVEGMQWSGKACVGSPQRLGRSQAMAAATARRNAEGKPWRLPRVPELRHLATQWAQMEVRAPVPFPAAPQEWYWTSSTTVNTSGVNQYDYGAIRRGVTTENAARLRFLNGWAVRWPTGEADGDVHKRTPLAVRLVRSLDP